MIRKQLARPVSALACILVVTACADAVAPTAPDVSLAAQGGKDRLASWFDQASPAVMALPGAVFADHDERANKLVFGVENAAAIPGIRVALARLGVPSSAYEMEVTEPIYQMATLRDVFRPTQAGIQIHFGQYLCTMGFNVSHSAGRSFITNSHCTNRQGGTEGTQYYQPSSGINGTVIATEAADPGYFRGGACPKGKKCRYSDASRALYASGTASNQGDILKTTGANNGSLTVAGVFTISSQDNTTSNFALGTVVNKVGRTTGWTQGEVTRTCVHTGVQGTNIAQLCQTFVSNPGGAVVVGSGDSGSPVFRITSGDNVQLVGILWGGSSDNRTFIYSPLKQIQDELGAVTATK
ncbi:MAG TPA: hypothetical protein VJ802_07915 [Gemmatimonadaceae bacterium]|nr:hypothetical protein [Gemmatimonadaceae bacterium]